jgi:hypothetical protein
VQKQLATPIGRNHQHGAIVQGQHDAQQSQDGRAFSMRRSPIETHHIQNVFHGGKAAHRTHGIKNKQRNGVQHQEALEHPHQDVFGCFFDHGHDGKVLQKSVPTNVKKNTFFFVYRWM